MASGEVPFVKSQTCNGIVVGSNDFSLRILSLARSFFLRACPRIPSGPRSYVRCRCGLPVRFVSKRTSFRQSGATGPSLEN
jgi:hypothetical protein